MPDFSDHDFCIISDLYPKKVQDAIDKEADEIVNQFCLAKMDCENGVMNEETHLYVVARVLIAIASGKM